MSIQQLAMHRDCGKTRSVFVEQFDDDIMFLGHCE